MADVAAPAVRTPQETRSEAIDRWGALIDFLQTEFHNPDIEALQCILAASRAHYSDDQPVWLFVIGPSGSGKTAIAGNAVLGLPQSHLEGDVNMQAMMNCSKGGEKMSMLASTEEGGYGHSFILVFKDFTSILSKRDEDQKELIGLMRELYDGAYERKRATRWGSWKGKATIIACVTPAIERAWAVHRSLGERFLQVRWPNSDPIKISRHARRQRGREKEISKRMIELVRDLHKITVKLPAPHLTEEQGERIDHLSSMVALLRTHVTRDSHGDRSVIEVSSPEEPTRIGKCLETLACYHALLWGRDHVTDDDLNIAIRVGFDSIPAPRSKIIRSIPLDASMGLTDIAKMAEMIRATVEWNADELEAIKVLQHKGSMADEIEYSFTPQFAAMWEKSMSTPATLRDSP